MPFTAIGSWPGTDARDAQARVRDLCADLPYLVELPSRGPGAAMIGRTAALLPGLPVELDRPGWTLTPAPGRDLARARALWRESLDVLAETFDGYQGALKVQVAGPWTLAAELRWRGDRVLADPGASRDVGQALVAAVDEHVSHVRSLVPGADVVVQIDEPCLPRVLGGGFATSSGFAAFPAVPEDRALAALAPVVAGRVVHCCAPRVPVDLLRRAGAAAVALDGSLLDAAGWEEVAGASEAGLNLWLGIDAGGASVSGALQTVLGPWRRLGLPARSLAGVTLTPPCGLAGVAGPREAASHHVRLAEASRELQEVAGG